MIRINNISKSFGNKKVLRDISFQVGDGKAYGLIGKNGAGKTTLMTVIAGLCRADGGNYDTQSEKVGYLPDVPEFYNYLTCGEYLDYLLMDLKGGSNTRNVLLRRVLLNENTKIGTMSRGMKQRLAIAAVLSNDPSVILFDEPTSALDPEGRSIFRDIIEELKGKGKSIILSTHILNDMEKICDEVGFLSGGVIKREIKMTELKEGSSFRVRFSEPYISREEKFSFGVSILSDREVVFELDKREILKSQQELFEHIIRTENVVAAIENERRSLDSIFKEVCGE